jgi:hypothetical protein
MPGLERRSLLLCKALYSSDVPPQFGHVCLACGGNGGCSFFSVFRNAVAS